MASPSDPIFSLPAAHLARISEPVRDLLSRTPYETPQQSSVSIKSLLQSLLPPQNPQQAHRETTNLLLCLAALSSAASSDSPTLYWIPKPLSSAADSAFRDLSVALGFSERHQLVAALAAVVLPEIKGVIRRSCVDETEDDFTAASARAPVEEALVAAHQFRWLVSQVGYPHLGSICAMVIPCALTALDHWSPEVKEQGMHSLIHIGKNLNAAELGWYEEPILDACCRNIASSDELWQCVVEMSVLLLTCTQRRNPRSYWFERILGEMLGHLERQPLKKERRIAWLLHIEPLFDAMGLVLLAHFRRIFSLFFQWMHADDDRTILLVMQRLHSIIKLTWIRKSPYIDRLVDELILLYKEAATRKSREVIRSHILHMLIFLQKSKGLQFEMSWKKHENDPDLTKLISSFVELPIETPMNG